MCVNRLRILDESYQRRSNDFVGEKQNQFCQNKMSRTDFNKFQVFSGLKILMRKIYQPQDK